MIVASSDQYIAVWNYENLKYEGYCLTHGFSYGVVKILEPFPIVAAASSKDMSIELYNI